MNPRADVIVYAAITNAPLIGAACLGLALLGAVAVVLLDKAEARIVERSHVPLKDEGACQ